MPWTPDNLLIVRETERAVIYEDGVYSETLEPGRHYVPKRYRFFTCTYYPVYDILMVDLREREVKLSDQKALTRDRQTISYSAWVAYQIDKNGLEILKHDKDQAALYTSVAKLEDRVKSDIELAAQRAIGLTNSERIIEERMAVIADFARELGERLATRGLLIASSDLRDFSIGDGTKSDKKGDDKPSVDFSGDWKAKLIANLPKSG
jgi:regulator of protease activity HflC (stomatin/prohibitin superfamily)